MGGVVVVSSGRRWTSYTLQSVQPVDAFSRHLDRTGQDVGVVTLLDFQHDNIVRHTLVIAGGKCIFLQLEHYHWTLRDLLAEPRRIHQPIALGVSFSLILGISKAFEYFHSTGIAHCYVAPNLVSLDDSTCLASYTLHLLDGHSEDGPHIGVWGLAAVAYERSVLESMNSSQNSLQHTLDRALAKANQIEDSRMRLLLQQMLTLEHVGVGCIIGPLEQHAQSYGDYAWYPALDSLSFRQLDFAHSRSSCLSRALELSREQVQGMFTGLQDAVSAFVRQGSRWIQQHALAVLARVGEAGDGNALVTLLEGRHDGKYVLTTERAALIRILADCEGDALLSRGYTHGYIRSLKGLPTADIAFQPDGWNSWFRYAEQGNTHCLENLLDQAGTRLDVSVTRNFLARKGVTAMMIATVLNYTSVSRMLAKLESGLVEKDASRTALMIAAECGSLDVMQTLVEEEGGLRTDDDKTALMIAVNRNNVKAVALLRNVETKMRDKTGTTALIQAARYGYMSMVKMLAESEQGMQNAYSQTALTVAIKYNHVETAQYLLSFEAEVASSAPYTPLMAAAESNNRQLVERFIDTYMKCQDRDGTTAMMYAAQHGHTEIVKVLLPAEKTMRNAVGETALMFAAKFNYPEIVALLGPVEGAIATDSGETAMDYAEKRGFAPIVELLRSIKADRGKPE